jgi:hypothetical protein
MTRMHRDTRPRTAAIEEARRALLRARQAFAPTQALAPASDGEQARRLGVLLLDEGPSPISPPVGAGARTSSKAGAWGSWRRTH